eukprot:2969458-Pyramimonas_sp.AAC.1
MRNARSSSRPRERPERLTAAAGGHRTCRRACGGDTHRGARPCGLADRSALQTRGAARREAQ